MNDELERQLKWDLLRQKEAWDIGQKYNDPELQQRAHDRAELARAISKAAYGEIPEGYGANNSLSETQAIFNQEYGQPQQYNFQKPPAERLTQQTPDGKDIANENFATGQGQRKAQFNDFQARKMGEEIVGLKRQWGALEGLIQQYNEVLHNPTATQEKKQYAQQRINAARQSQIQLNQTAEQMRTRASGLGLDFRGYGSGDKLSESETNLGFELDKAIRDMFVDQYSRNSADYYNRRYNEYRAQGLSKRHARERADTDASQYQYDRMRAAKDLFMNVGMNGGQLTDYGMALAQIMAEEGDPAAAELWMNGYASPYQAWGKTQDRIDEDLAHARNEDTAENNLRRQLEMLQFGLNSDLKKMDQSQQYKLDQIDRAGEWNERSQANKFNRDVALANLNANQKLQLLAQRRNWKLEDQAHIRTLENDRALKAISACVKLGMSEEEAYLLVYGFINPQKMNSKSQKPKTENDTDKLTSKQEEALNVADNWDQELVNLINSGQKDAALEMIDLLEESLKEEEYLKYDSQIMGAFRETLKEYRKQLTEDSNEKSNRNPPAKNPKKPEKPPTGTGRLPDPNIPWISPDKQAEMMQDNRWVKQTYFPYR